MSQTLKAFINAPNLFQAVFNFILGNKIMSFISNFKAKFVLINPMLGSILLLAGTTINSNSAIALPSQKAISIETAAKQTQQNLISQGRSAYQAGRYVEAKSLWQKAYKHAQGNRLTQAQSLNYLALTSHKLGEWQQAKEYLTESLKLLPEDTSDTNTLKIKAQTFNTQGRLELSMGKAVSALASWQKAAKIYQQVGDDVGTLGIEINQAQAWQNLGLYRRAQKSLQKIAQKLESQSDSSLKIAGWRNLGIALQVTGDLKLATESLNQSLALSQELNLTEESSATLFNLGNTALASEDKDRAISFYQQAAAATSQPVLKTEAQLNQLGLLISQQQWQQANNLLPEIEANLTTLPTIPSRKLVYLRVNLAKNLIQLSENSANQKHLEQTQQLLKTSIQQAKELEDTQAESYAVGMLGRLYEESQQLSLGRKYTQEAVYLAETINNSDLTYQWQWQLGRLLDAQGNNQGAIASYTGAVNALESLRSDLGITNADLQFSFRASIIGHKLRL